LASKFRIGLLLFLVFFLSELKAQVCTGALGTPIIGAGTDFGNGNTSFGNPLSTSITSYNYIAGTPNDGQYTIVKTTAGLNPGWHQNIVNHTPNDPNGYFMVVNANLNKGIFYQTEITNQLCSNTTYEFAAYIINILRNPGVKPNIKFTITNNDLPIPGAEFITGDIPEGTATDWIKRGGTFKTPNTLGVIKLIMTNENPGGNGNDLALDDITFRPCGPQIKPVIVSTNASNADICAGQTVAVDLSAEVSSVYNNPAYQWQINDGNGWTNLTVSGSQTKNVTIDFNNAIIGTYNYQLLVAEDANINSPNCRIVSSPLTVNVVANPKPVASFSGVACVGNSLTLNVNGNIGDKFAWTGPDGYTSSDQDPTLSNITLANSGEYQVTVTNSSNCSTLSPTLNILVLPPIAAKIDKTTIEICEEEQTQLLVTAAPGQTYTYNWLPAAGLSDPKIANPIAKPNQTTTYTVTVSNGNCTETVDVTISVLQKAKADAGEDKKILAGQSVALNGKASGDGALTYAWKPTTYLDDPSKLNPIATPPTDITYTLTVTSACNETTDEVFVKVYPKIAIPNAFSPNGDGINDTWNVSAAIAFTNPQLKIFNRNGQILYQSKGAFKPWDGKFNGHELPVAAYYYTLFLNEDFKPFTGWILLTR